MNTKTINNVVVIKPAGGSKEDSFLSMKDLLAEQITDLSEDYNLAIDLENVESLGSPGIGLLTMFNNTYVQPKNANLHFYNANKAVYELLRVGSLDKFCYRTKEEFLKKIE